MSYQPDAMRPLRDKRAEFDLADKARAEKRKQDDALIDSGAQKWRYKPVMPTAKVPE